ncbi:MAG TPA: hypothetical protein VJ914_29840 [Pseudonocardiaceae bacterium]|nr:hypothetical protein [Pseudonocardiaceae bacterium]
MEPSGDQVRTVDPVPSLQANAARAVGRQRSLQGLQSTVGFDLPGDFVAMFQAVQYIYDQWQVHKATRDSLIVSNDAAQKLFVDLEWNDLALIRTAINTIAALRDTMQKFLDAVDAVYSYAMTPGFASFAQDVVNNYRRLRTDLEARIEELEDMLEVSRQGKERLEEAARQ